MCDTAEDVEWDSIVQTTFTVVDDEKGRGNAFDHTVARTLNVSGEFQVCQILKFAKKYGTFILPTFLRYSRKSINTFRCLFFLGLVR